MSLNRRTFVKNTLSASMGAMIVSKSPMFKVFNSDGDALKISLAEWSLHKALFAGEITNLDFPERAKDEFGIHAVEYVSQFFKGTGKEYLGELLKRGTGSGMKNVLIMIDNEGNLGDLYEPSRIQAVERHYRWIDAAKILGCHSIRVNARGEGTADEVSRAAIDGLGRLTEYGAKQEINVIVENHGGYSSDGKWLSNVISQVNSKFCGTLPDFGNFCIKSEEMNGRRTCVENYDRYQGVKDLMPFAKGVSAKTYDFDSDGNETAIDYERMMQIVKDAGYTGHIGIEFEGRNLSEKEGILASKKLLEKYIGA